MSEATENKRGVRKERNGTVCSRSGEKSIVVVVERRRSHPLYGKVIKEKKKFHVHDEKDVAKVGDTVRIAECRPMSKMKRWRLLEVTRASQEDTV